MEILDDASYARQVPLGEAPEMKRLQSYKQDATTVPVGRKANPVAAALARLYPYYAKNKEEKRGVRMYERSFIEV